jgi:hypothetical protein
MSFFLNSRHVFFLIYALLFFLQSDLALGQVKISGHVSDFLTNEAIPFANVAFKGLPGGSRTDLNGDYTIQSDTPSDSLSASFVGYKKVTVKISKTKPVQTYNFVLRVNKLELHEVVVDAGINPALILLKKIQSNKDKNDRNNLKAYQYETYNKMEFDINNISQNFKNRKILKPFAFIFDKMDSSESNEKPFLPMFISESISDVYYTSDPKNKKEFVKATKVSGLENASINQFMGDMYQNINLYDNFIPMFNKGFVSPLANVGTLYYKYYLLDSMFLGNQWCYKIKFKPRRKQDLTFVGDFWVHDTTFAIKKINMRVSEGANINFIEDIVIAREYERTNNTNWMVKKDIFVVNFLGDKDQMGFIGRKTTSYKDIVIDQPKPPEFFKGNELVVVADDAREKDASYWTHARHDSLAKREKAIYQMVDTIKTLPAFKTYLDIITLVVSGYKTMGMVELGPYFNVYSYNGVEGNRFRFGGRTSSAFSTNLILDGYVAYGTLDQKIKYGGGFQYFLSKKPRVSVGMSHKNDVELIGASQNAFKQDNILASVLRRIPFTKLTAVVQEKAFYERDWWPGFSSRISFTHRRFAPRGTLNYDYFAIDRNGNEFVTNKIRTSDVALYTRYAYQEKFLEGKRSRISLGTKYPIFKMEYVLGAKGFFGSNFGYQKLKFRIEQKVKISPIGYFWFYAETGQVFGTLPYPLLEVHSGNETYTLDKFAFNLMNYYEFVSDRYASLQVTHHFNGFFLDKIPLMRKLKWREVATFSGIIGSMSSKNRELTVNKNAFYTLEKPYMEVGTGIENIFKLVRVDAVWRLTHLDHPNISQFGIRANLQILF